jgi:UDP-2,4-diacetamido-2,4,6-trideoxy-beta-L-altropyranose hydrolase
MTTITIRADCDHEIGYGHIMRSLVVAEAMKSKADFETVFVMNAGSDTEPVRRAGHSFRHLTDTRTDPGMSFWWANPEDGPVFIDSYSVTVADLELMEREGFCIAMFEDANRLGYYPCDVVIDPSPNATGLGYRGAPRTHFCLGPNYFPLRGEFSNTERKQSTTQSIDQIVVTFGGSDPDDQAARLESILTDMNLNTNIRIVLGPGYTGRASGGGNIELVQNAEAVAPIFSTADMVISGGGATALELAYLGLPMILIGLADNQIANARAIEAAGAAKYLGPWTDISEAEIVLAVSELMNDPDRRQAMVSNGQKLVDGKAAGRISKHIDLAWREAQIRQGGIA